MFVSFQNLPCSRLVVLLAALLMWANASTADGQNARMNKEMREQIELQHMMMKLMSISNNPQLQKELDFVDDQLKDLEKMARDFQARFMKFNASRQEEMLEIQELVNNGEHKKAMEKSKKIQAENMEFMKEYREKANDLILPHQMKRLRQISRQESLKYQSGYGDEFGVPFALADDIGLTAAEKGKLRDAIQEAREEYYEKLEKLKAAAHKKILASIPKEKRGKLEEFLGKKYDGSAETRTMLRNQRERQSKGK